ncbi:MAG TPA: alpha/beta hydrolase [Thermoleophilaceae bacterium]|nr:alpha/beta hydrolase [Thermoleophilaceae bacterium]
MEPARFQVQSGEQRLAGEDASPPEPAGPPLVLLHGLTATRRNVLQGSRHLLGRGRRLVAYDARGHGASSPAPAASAYEYTDLVADLEGLLDHHAIDSAVLVGSSMGAATAMALALRSPGRVRALVQITPAYDGQARAASGDDSWARMAGVLEREGIDAFVEEALPSELPERWRASVSLAIRQRMERHEHLGAVLDALRVVPYSQAWDGLEPLEELNLPVLVVGSRDEADPTHPLAVAEEYARRLPNARLVVEEQGKSPLAWQGARLSAAIGSFLDDLDQL